jgi:hypothetical protein
MNDDSEDTGKKLQESPEDIDSEAAAGSEGEFKCTPCEHGAGTTQKAARSPGRPTSKEVEEHDLTHCPYRAWCDHCVKGQAKDDGHSTVKGELADSSVVRVALDYCFFQEDLTTKDTEHEESTKAKTSMTVLVMLETLCHSVWAYVVESKGASEEWVIDQIVEDLETVGLSGERIIVKADQETSITDVQKGILKARTGHGTAIEQSKVGTSNSNGRIERCIQDFKGLVRTLRSVIEEKLGVKIHLTDPVVPWLVRHAAHTITSSRVREDGRTAYQLMKGRRSNAKLVPFCETVLFKIPKTQHKIGDFENRWERGVWVGFIMRSGEHLVATKAGVFRVSTVMRRSPDKRWSADLVGQIGGSPSIPVPGAVGRRIPAFAKKFEDTEGEKVVFAQAPEEAEPEVRVAKIYKEDVEEHGPTPKCPGCRALKNGSKYRAKHSDECRTRFEALLSETDAGKKRFEAARERRLEGITKKAMVWNTKPKTMTRASPRTRRQAGS